MARQLPSDVVDRILQILKRGNCAEVKLERDALVVVEIERHVRIKSTDAIDKP